MNDAATGSVARGATPQEWQHFDLVLGLGADMLPVVPDPNAVPSANSRVKAFGKIPSVYTQATGNEARGIGKWTELSISPGALEMWARDARLGFCVRSSAVRALDVDVTDATLSQGIQDTITEYLSTYDIVLPQRVRENAPKFLLPFRLAGPYAKRIINTEHGRIEFLADGQQWVAAGCHPSGVRYQWLGGLPNDIPTITPECFEELWIKLKQQYAAEPEPHTPPHYNDDPADIKRAVDGALTYSLSVTLDSEETAKDLRAALAYPPLLKAAASNDVWSEVGYALLSLGGTGRELFQQFSAQADNFKPGDPEQWWEEHTGQPTRTDYRHIFTLARKLGWGAVADLGAFPICEPANQRPVESGHHGGVGGVSGGAASDGAFTLNDAAAAALRAGTVPEAFNLCTDQANANRIKAHFGNRLRAIAGKFYAYTGTHWTPSESEAARCAASLGAVVKVEAEAARTKFKSLCDEAGEEARAQVRTLLKTKRRDQSKAEDDVRALVCGREIIETLYKMESLEKWQKHCEMQPTQAKALEMVRKMLTVDAAQLDLHHNYLNCPNGTVNLITGELMAHDPTHYISKCTPVAYDATAACPHFEQFLIDILDAERATFLQHWFGYGITGETREQRFMLHIGEGGNGKGTMIRLLEETMGRGYLGPAAPNLLVGNNERHPTEVADLQGMRTVFSQETDEGAYLREGFLKNMSGEDSIKARFLYADFFSFRPTFKINLSTNNEPNVRGTDNAIWRRIYLIKYPHKYGTAADVAAGTATRVADIDLTARLSAERAGILAWLVRGARHWYAHKLQAPKSVVIDSDQYRSNQDRMAKFISDRCVVDPLVWSPFTNGMGALYPAYVSWCKESGYLPMGLNKFGSEIARAAPTAKLIAQPRRGGGRPQGGIQGLRLDQGSDTLMGSFPITSSNEDLL